jgi:TetR/AcrR family tetracycline transcriptional repressor
MPLAERTPSIPNAGGKKRARGRAPWGSISREKVIDAAAKAMHDGGYEQMTIRSLASDLGVGPMSLYRHVRDKDDLLDEVTDRLLAKTWRPRVRRSNWENWIADAAERLRSLLVSQPAALHVYLSHPVVSPAAIARMEAMLVVLRNAGFDETSARRAYGAIHTYTIGFAALQASRHRSGTSDDSTDAMVNELATFTTPQRFKEGLGFLLEGIRGHTRS